MKCQNDLEMGDEDSSSLQLCVQLLQALIKRRAQPCCLVQEAREAKYGWDYASG